MRVLVVLLLATVVAAQWYPGHHQGGYYPQQPPRSPFGSFMNPFSMMPMMPQMFGYGSPYHPYAQPPPPPRQHAPYPNQAVRQPVGPLQTSPPRPSGTPPVMPPPQPAAPFAPSQPAAPFAPPQPAAPLGPPPPMYPSMPFAPYNPYGGHYGHYGQQFPERPYHQSPYGHMAMPSMSPYGSYGSPFGSFFPFGAGLFAPSYDYMGNFLDRVSANVPSNEPSMRGTSVISDFGASGKMRTRVYEFDNQTDKSVEDTDKDSTKKAPLAAHSTSS